MPTADAAARDRAASNQIRTTLVIARQAQRLSLTQLAEQVGCYANQINKWEQPDGPVPGIDWMARWAAALGYEIALLSKVIEGTFTKASAEQIEASARVNAEKARAAVMDKLGWEDDRHLAGGRDYPVACWHIAGEIVQAVAEAFAQPAESEADRG